MSYVQHDHSPRRENIDREASPTETEGLQREYRIELERRFRALRGVLRETVDTNDALRLRDGRTNATARDHAFGIGPRRRFPFRQSAMKQAAFQTQLREWLDTGILEPVGEDAIEAGEHYTGTYVRSSYREGVRWADQQLRGQGVSVGEVGEAALQATFDQPIHTETLESLYTRNFEKLEDITSDLDRILSRELTQGLIAGENPRTIANRLSRETRAIQRGRARRLARTETLRAHNAGAGRRYQEMGVQRVDILTHDPCPVCQSIAAGGPYPVREAHQLVPENSHPNCVCAVVPKI